MSNSKLVNYIKLSPNHSGARTRTFNDKSYPSDWLYNRLGDLAKSVTEQDGYAGLLGTKIDGLQITLT